MSRAESISLLARLAFIAAGDSRALRRQCMEAVVEIHHDADSAAASAAELALRADDEARFNEAVLMKLLASPAEELAGSATLEQPSRFFTTPAPASAPVATFTGDVMPASLSAL